MSKKIDSHQSTQGQQIALEAIKKKLLGKKLSYHEIYHLMDEISRQKMSDVLTTYFVAASFKEGFTDKELYFLTKAMVETGTTIKFDGIVADKHSTGGLSGTRTTMIIVPIIAAAGFKIPKLSSRAITSPAGTADTMEVLADVTLSPKAVKQIVEKVGGCIVWNGMMGIAPADDIIIEVEEPLSFESYDKIIISIMAKKVAVSTNHLVLDIPVGPTMKIRRLADGEKIAKKFRRLARHFKINLVVDVNESFEPAGRGVGPVLEVRDVLQILEQKDDRPLKLEAKAIRLAGKLLDICYKTAKIDKSGEEEAIKLLSSGAALKKFKEIVAAQNGKVHITADNIKIAEYKKDILADKKGKVMRINNFNLNSIAKVLGAPHDKFAGLYLLKKFDDYVEKKETLAVLYSSDKYRLKEAHDSCRYLPIYDVK